MIRFCHRETKLPLPRRNPLMRIDSLGLVGRWPPWGHVTCLCRGHSPLAGGRADWFRGAPCVLPDAAVTAAACALRFARPARGQVRAASPWPQSAEGASSPSPTSCVAFPSSPRPRSRPLCPPILGPPDPRRRGTTVVRPSPRQRAHRLPVPGSLGAGIALLSGSCRCPLQDGRRPLQFRLVDPCAS